MASDKLSLYRGFTLGQWRVEPLQGHIVSPDGAKLHVAPKAMDVLVCLALRSGELVERATIFSEVWGEPPWSDEALTHCVGELRHAFSDKPEHPEFFQTVPKRGYRLLADISGNGDQDQPAPTTDDDPPNGWFAKQIGDLRKRKVFQIVVGYPVLAWLLLQIVDIVWEYLLQPLGAPAWLVPTIVVLLALGYPVAVFFAWAVDYTPEGVKVTNIEGDKPVAGLITVSALTVSIAAVAMFVYFNAYDSTDPATPVPGGSPPIKRFDQSIAVMRFANLGANAADSYIGDGLTEELIHALTNLTSMKVAARTSVWQLSTGNKLATEICDILQVRRVLEGSIRVEGEQLRVTAQLIDEDGFHIWSQTYDDKIVNVLDVQRDIASQVVDELGVVLSHEAVQRLAESPTEIGAAYDRYLQGKQFLRSPSTDESLSAADRLFAEAIDIDARFALAHAGRCEVSLARYRITRDLQNFEDAERSCHRALTLDGGLAEVYTSLGNLYRTSGQFVEAEQEYLTALRINATLEEANFGLGRAYQSQGRLEEAEATLRRSVELEPGFWGSYMGVGNFLFRQGRYADAVDFYERVTVLAPDFAGGFINLGAARHWLGDWNNAELAWQTSLELNADAWAFSNLGTLRYFKHDYVGAAEYFTKALELTPEDHRHVGKLADSQRHTTGQEQLADRNYQRAIELVEAQLELNPDEPEDLQFLATYRLHTGSMVAADEALTRAIELAPDSPVGPYVLALLQIEAGDTASAVAQLDKAVQLGYSLRILEQDPDLAALQDLSDFQELFD
jgi:TolB-like protein/tetratricopeptide (TPR) repeat protein/DNA-binding winged helix-turn-helix (wHTH) protein